jgi:hypothetical protein
MTTTARDPLLDEYLRDLERVARVLPRAQRDELLAEIRDHLDAGLEPDIALLVLAPLFVGAYLYRAAGRQGQGSSREA